MSLLYLSTTFHVYAEWLEGPINCVCAWEEGGEQGPYSRDLGLSRQVGGAEDSSSCLYY